MNRKFTDDDIIRFIYNEMEPHESEVFLGELCSDESLWERYESLQEIAAKTKAFELEPSEAAVANVMAYVRDTSPYFEQPGRFEKIKDATRSYLVGKIPVAISLNAVIIVAFIMFVTVAIMGSAYELTRGGIDNPNTGVLVQQVDEDLDPEMYRWDDSDIEEELKEIRQGVENLREDPVL